MSNTQQQQQNQNTQIVKQNISPSERFTQMVMKEFTSVAGNVQITNFQKKIIQNYFIKLDMVLKASDLKRLEKNSKARNEGEKDLLEYSWNNVNMQQLALDVVSFSSIGLDPLQKNHINLIPYKNSKTEKYDITFMMGYDGMELKARKYGYDIPDDVVIELVYANDTFKIHKKNKDNRVESYTFEINDPFDRGEVIGGFYYHVYYEHPEKNKLRHFTKSQIDKRKPKYASAEFWGGERNVWEYDSTKKKNVIVGKENVDGWYEEMAWKTIKRAAYDAITIDSEKIDEHFLKAIQAERAIDSDPVASRVASDISENANVKTMDFDDAEIVEDGQKDLPPATEKIEVPLPEKEADPVPGRNNSSKGGTQTQAPF